MTVKYHYNKFPPSINVDNELHDLVNQARTALGRYDGFLLNMLNSSTLLSPLFTQEAVLSSRIEGTQSTLTDVLKYEGDDIKDFTKQQEYDIKEILNYRLAMEQANNALKDGLPLAHRVICQSHKILMQDVRGANKSPGNYRKIPVWIGGASIGTARYVPIDANQVANAMSQLEHFMHSNSNFDDLIKVAMIHAEFESIHPFLDGNGRLGRMIVPLYLNSKDLINKPYFYISSFLEKNREQYYELLLNISKNNEWLEWCKFFINGIIKTAEDNLLRATKITEYYRDLKQQLPTLTKSQYGITALDYMFKRSYFSSVKFYNEVNIPKPTAYRLLSVFSEKNILQCKSKGKGRSPNFYIFRKLIDIADGK